MLVRRPESGKNREKAMYNKVAKCDYFLRCSGDTKGSGVCIPLTKGYGTFRLENTLYGVRLY